MEQTQDCTLRWWKEEAALEVQSETIVWVVAKRQIDSPRSTSIADLRIDLRMYAHRLVDADLKLFESRLWKRI